MPNPSLTDLVKLRFEFDSSISIPRDCKLGIGYGSENKTRSKISFLKFSYHNAFQIYKHLI